MFSTTILIAIQMQYVKHLPIYITLAFFLAFGFLDGMFCASLCPPFNGLTYIEVYSGVRL